MAESQGAGAILEFDVEGNAFSLHFPTVKDADTFKRGVVTGALAASLVIGGAAGAAQLASHSNVPTAASGASAMSLDEARALSNAEGAARMQAAAPGTMTLDEARALSLAQAPQIMTLDEARNLSLAQGASGTQAAPEAVPGPSTLDQIRHQEIAQQAARMAAGESDPSDGGQLTEQHHVEGAGR